MAVQGDGQMAERLRRDQQGFGCFYLNKGLGFRRCSQIGFSLQFGFVWVLSTVPSPFSSFKPHPLALTPNVLYPTTRSLSLTFQHPPTISLQSYLTHPAVSPSLSLNSKPYANPKY